MEPTPKIRLRPRPVLALALVVVALVGVLVRSTGSFPSAVTPSTTRGHVVTTTTLALAAPVGDVAAYRAPGGGCAFDASASRSAATGGCRVLEFGDSLGIDFGEGLSREVSLQRGVNLSIHGLVSTGLVNTAFYNWPARLRYLLAKFKPQLVVALIGANDQHSIRVGSSSARFGSSRWQRAYLSRVRQIAADVINEHGYLLWIGLPPMRDWRYERGAKLMNSLVARVATTTAGMKFLSTARLLSTPHGRYVQWARVNGTRAQIRSDDGIHFRPIGDDVLATYVVREIATIYHVALVPRSARVVTAW